MKPTFGMTTMAVLGKMLVSAPYAFDPWFEEDTPLPAV
jgi:hypothetical protein